MKPGCPQAMKSLSNLRWLRNCLKSHSLKPSCRTGLRKIRKLKKKAFLDKLKHEEHGGSIMKSLEKHAQNFEKKRKEELTKIMTENQKILARLKNRKSYLNVQKMKQDFKKTEEISRMISKNHYEIAQKIAKKNKSHKSRVRYNKSQNTNSLPNISKHVNKKSVDMGFSKDNLKDEKQEEPVKMENLEVEAPPEVMQSDRYHKNPQTTRASINLSPMKVKDSLKNASMPAKRKVIYLKPHKLNKKEFLIEISKAKAKYYIVALRINKSQTQQIIEVHSKKAKKMIKNAGGIQGLVQHLGLKFGKVVIENMDRLLTHPVGLNQDTEHDQTYDEPGEPHANENIEIQDPQQTETPEKPVPCDSNQESATKESPAAAPNKEEGEEDDFDKAQNIPAT
ncbi:unnamed protein product [Moneuplotes crassus]|uniref:Uncharacterized protein n=1 Tax=Euplotes crassus TaxID=5936 RepID=A0AAD1X9E6_EUPCR|nr:unnamed protein product [Moneuplotes crassus]